MIARRRKIFIAAALIAAVAVVAWWTTTSGPGTKMELRFLGYSNHMEVAQPYWNSASPWTSAVSIYFSGPCETCGKMLNSAPMSVGFRS